MGNIQCGRSVKDNSNDIFCIYPTYAEFPPITLYGGDQGITFVNSDFNFELASELGYEKYNIETLQPGPSGAGVDIVIIDQCLCDIRLYRESAPIWSCFAGSQDIIRELRNAKSTPDSIWVLEYGRLAQKGLY